MSARERCASWRTRGGVCVRLVVVRVPGDCLGPPDVRRASAQGSWRGSSKPLQFGDVRLIGPSWKNGDHAEISARYSPRAPASPNLRV